jgi:thiol-disulfide isomerase/thioredoxin
MTPLPSQEFLESLIQKNPKVPHKKNVCIRFTASWCGPCKRIDPNYLLSVSDDITWYVCDADENDYSLGYCGVTTIPAFMPIINGVPQKLFQSSDNQKIGEWLKATFNV